MKRFPLMLVAALLGVAVSVPAQFNDHGRSGRQSRNGAAVSQQRSAVVPRPVRSTNGAVGRQVQPVQSYRTGQVGRVTHNGNAGRGPSAGRVVLPIPIPVAVGRSGSHRHNHGHWENRCEQVLVPGYWDVQCHPATYGWVLDFCGHRVWGVVEPAHNHRVWVPARYETQTRRVWVSY